MNSKVRSKLLLARRFKQEIADLQTQREQLYIKAIQQLKVLDTNKAFDYFFNDQVGFSSFEEGLQ